MFNIQKGRVYSRNLKNELKDRGDRFWKIKDPFIKEFSYGNEFSIRGEEWSSENNPKRRLKTILEEMKALVDTIDDCKGEKWMYPVVVVPEN